MAFSDRGPSMHDFAPSWLKVPQADSKQKGSQGGGSGRPQGSAGHPPSSSSHHPQHHHSSGHNDAPYQNNHTLYNSHLPTHHSQHQSYYNQQQQQQQQQGGPPHHQQYHHNQYSQSHHSAAHHTHGGSGGNQHPPHLLNHHSSMSNGKQLFSSGGSGKGPLSSYKVGGPQPPLLGGSGGGGGMGHNGSIRGGPGGGGMGGGPPGLNGPHISHKYSTSHRASHQGSDGSSIKSLQEEDFPSLNGGGPQSATRDQHYWSWGKQQQQTPQQQQQVSAGGSNGGVGQYSILSAGGVGVKGSLDEGGSEGGKMFRGQVKRIARKPVATAPAPEKQDNRGFIELGSGITMRGNESGSTGGGRGSMSSPILGSGLTPQAVMRPSSNSGTASPTIQMLPSAPVSIPNRWGSTSTASSTRTSDATSVSSPSDVFLSASLEKEQRLLKEMGWKEVDSSGEDTLLDMGEQEKAALLNRLLPKKRLARERVVSRAHYLSKTQQQRFPLASLTARSNGGLYHQLPAAMERGTLSGSESDGL